MTSRDTSDQQFLAGEEEVETQLEVIKVGILNMLNCIIRWLFSLETPYCLLDQNDMVRTWVKTWTFIPINNNYIRMFCFIVSTYSMTWNDLFARRLSRKITGFLAWMGGKTYICYHRQLEIGSRLEGRFEIRARAQIRVDSNGPAISFLVYPQLYLKINVTCWFWASGFLLVAFIWVGGARSRVDLLRFW